MANLISGRFWNLDTAGVITDKPVFVDRVSITFKVSSAGVVDLAQFGREDGVVTESFVYAATLGATSAAADTLTQEFYIGAVVNGIQLRTITNIAKLIIQTR